MKKVKVIEITTATCGICKSIAPMIEKAVELLGDKVDFEKREVDWNDEIVTKYKVRQVPTFLFLDDEKLLGTHSGAIMLPAFTKLVTKYHEEINA